MGQSTATSTGNVTAPATSPLVRYVHHVSFRVDDLLAALDFYCGSLGFEKLDRPELSIPGAWLQCHDVQVHLIEKPADVITGTPPTAPNGLANHVAFTVDSLEPVIAEFERVGLEIGKGSLGQIFVQDPSGNVLEFTKFGR